ncbi:MAG: ATP-binding cassette domain-containing protein [Acidimicrobiales bacterium]|nr:ATP-binding cassette domain-containing protein [Acidimicrobiales bacterium]RZV47664.1 MAG: ATP-binding cassette domain-containing protein [Acidimicrobiales bacterium]
MVGIGTEHLRDADDAILRVEDLVVEFSVDGGTLRAVAGVSFDVQAGETLSIVGESGCGKSTTAKAVIHLEEPADGVVTFGDAELSALTGAELREVRRELQMIFQDPISSLNPRRAVRDIIQEPAHIWEMEELWGDEEIDEMMTEVGIDPQYGDRRPYQFSGGQCQRISIARALVLNPKVLIADEPVSALDVSVQAQILNLLDDLKSDFQLTLLFISHDLAVVRNISDRVVVMYLGRVAEIGDADSLFDNPSHPYTRTLLAAVPGSGLEADDSISGELPSPLNPPTGCRFHTRCPYATEICISEVPVFTQQDPDHWVACHHPQ